MAGPLDEVGDYGYEEQPPPPPPPPPAPSPAPVAPLDLIAQSSMAPRDQRQAEIYDQVQNLEAQQAGVHPRDYQRDIRQQERELGAEVKGLNFDRQMEDRATRQAASAARQVQQQNRFKASDLAARGIPTYRDASGGVNAATDETGAPLTNLDKRHGIAYDSAGKPQELEYGPTGPPQTKDPFEGLPTRTDPKTGDQYQVRAGLPWKWTGQDEGIKTQRMQDAKDKAVAKESQLLGQKITMDHADYVAGDKEHEIMRKELLSSVPLLQDPKYAGADRDTVNKAIEEHFNTEYGAPEANETNGWLRKDLSPQAQELRAQIDKRKADAVETANNLFDLKDRQKELGESIKADRAMRRAELETQIAHQRGEAGPLDEPTAAGRMAQNLTPGAQALALQAAGVAPEQAAQPTQPARAPNFGPSQANGMLEPGNIDYNTRPVVQNPDGTTSTVRSFSIGTDKGEVLIPSLADDGRQMTKEEAIQQYKQTGQHLGIFAGPKSADAFAQENHDKMGPEHDLSPDAVRQAAQSGQIPTQAGPAAVAAAHDAADANAKAEALKDTNPGLAGQFKAAAQGILHGLALGVSEVVRGAPGVLKTVYGGAPTGQLSVADLMPVKDLTKLYGKAADSIREVAEGPQSGYDKELAQLTGGKIGNIVGGTIPFVALTLLPGGAAVTLPATATALFSAGYGSTHEAAIQAGADPLKADQLATLSGGVNAALAFIPIKGMGAALNRVFGGASAPVIKNAIENTFRTEGAEGVGRLLGQLKDYISGGVKPVIGGVAQDVKKQAVEAISNIQKEIGKTYLQRSGTVAKEMLKGGAVGAGSQTAQNVIAQQYDPERGTFQDVPETALGFGLLAGAVHGWDQVVAARRAKQALDVLNRGGGPPAGQPGLTDTGGPKGPQPPKPAKGRVVEPEGPKPPPVPPEFGGPAVEQPTTGGTDVSGKPQEQQGQGPTVQQTPSAEQPARGGGAEAQPIDTDAGTTGGPAPAVTTTGAEPTGGAATGAAPAAEGAAEPAVSPAVTTEPGGADFEALRGELEASTGEQYSDEAVQAHVDAAGGWPAVEEPPVEHKVEHGEHAQPGYTAVDTAELPSEGPATQAQTVAEAEAQLWRLTKDDDSQALTRIRKNYGSDPDYLDILRGRVDRLRETTGRTGEPPIVETPPVGEGVQKVERSPEAQKEIADAEARLWKLTRENRPDTLNRLRQHYYAHGNYLDILNSSILDAQKRNALAPEPKEEQVPTRETETAGPAPAAAGGAAPAEPRPEYQRVALKPVRKRPILEIEHDLSKPTAVKRHLERLLEQNSGPLAVTGTKVTFGTHKSPSGFQTDPVTADVSVDVDKLAVHAPRIEEHGGDPRGWLTSALQEEHWHALQVKTANEQFRPIYAGIYDKLDEDTKKKLASAYPDSTDPSELGAEYARMVLQDRAGETITETHHRDISPLLPAIAGEQSSELEAEIQKILGVGAEPKAAAPTGGSPWTNEQLQAVKGEAGYIPTVDLIAWAKGQPEFQQRVSNYKATSATGAEPDAVAMEEIAHDMAFDANERAGKPTVDEAATEAAPEEATPAQLEAGPAKQRVGTPEWATAKAPKLNEAGKLPEMKRNARKAMAGDIRVTADRMKQAGMIGTADEQVILGLIRKDFPTQLALEQAARTIARHIKKGKTDAVKPGHAQVEEGEAPLGEQERPVSEKPKPSGGDHVVGEAEGGGTRGEISGAEEEKPEPAGPSGGVPTLEQLRAKLREQEKAGAVDDRLLQQIRELEAEEPAAAPAHTEILDKGANLYWDRASHAPELKDHAAPNFLDTASGKVVSRNGKHYAVPSILSKDAARKVDLEALLNVKNNTGDPAILNAKDIHSVTPAEVERSGDGWKVVKKGSIQYGKPKVTPQVPAMEGMTPLGQPKKVEGIKPITLDEQAKKDLGDALEGLFASVPTPKPTKSIKMHAIHHALTEKGQSVEKVAREFAMKPQHIEAIYDAMRSPRPRMALMASEPFTQKDIPDEKLDAFVKAAKSMIRSGVDTPEGLAHVMPEAAYPYLQAMWDAFGMVKGSLRGTHDWPKIVEGIKAETAPEITDPEIGSRVKVVVKGETFIGLAQISAGLKWIEVKNHSPITLDEVDSIEQVNTADEVRAERQARKMGKIVYTQPKTRDEYEDTLWKLAGLVADHDIAISEPYNQEKAVRHSQLEAQFDKVADEIELAKAKRRYLLSQAINKREGKPLQRAHRLGSPYAEVRVPKPQDFDPDQQIRRKRWPRPLTDYMTKAEVEASLKSAQDQLKGKPTKIAAEMAQNIVDERTRQLEKGDYLEAAQEREKERLKTQESEVEVAPQPPKTQKPTLPRFTDPYGKTYTLYGWATDIKKIGDTPTGIRIGGSGWEWYVFSPIKGDILEGFVHGFEDEWGSFTQSELKENGIKLHTDPEELAKVAPPVGWKAAEPEKPKKPKTPQVPAITGMTPIGQPPAKKKETNEEIAKRTGFTLEMVEATMGPDAYMPQDEFIKRLKAKLVLSFKDAGAPQHITGTWFDAGISGKIAYISARGIRVTAPLQDIRYGVPKFEVEIKGEKKVEGKVVEKPVSWKAQIDDGSGFADNGLRFTEQWEAAASGSAIFNRWMGAKDMRVVESDEPVTHTWDKESGRPVEIKKPTKVKTGHEVIARMVRNRLLVGQPFTRTELTAAAESNGLTAKEADEAAEVGIVEAARDMQASRRSATPEEIFDRLVEMYNNQPNLTARTATSKLDQAYSTPVPLAWVASQLVDIKGGKKIYEPTAGNGMLLIEADPTSQQVFANELNDARAAELMSQGIKVVTVKDASEWHPNIKADRESMNPPFGTVQEDGKTKVFTVDGVQTTQIDHAIVLESLKSLADDGRAVLIVGGPGTNTGAIMEEKNRKEFYAQGQRGAFWKRLYAEYGVIDHFTVDGELYKKQGAGWPVDVVLIRGRGESPIQLPSAKAPRILTSWDDLRNELARTDAERIKAGTLTPEQAAEQISGAISKIGDVTKPRGRPERAGHEPPTEAGAGPATDVEGAGKPAGELPVPSPRGGHEAGGTTAGGLAGGTGAGRAGSEHEQPGRLDQAKEDLDNLLGGLMASEPFSEKPLTQEDLPEEKTEALLKAARSMVAAGVDTPEKLAAMVPAPAHKYLQAIWDGMGMIKRSLRATHDWPKIVAGLKPEHPPEGEPPTLGVQGQSFPEPTPQFRVRYKPKSKHKSLVEDGVFTPTNLELAQREALNKLFFDEDIDDFVMRKIGYQPHEKAKFTGEYFAAEQIDALALAIKATEKYDEPLAFILGDQGGIGKGRVAAGMILYAIQRGWIPAFFTKDIKLYAAMLNDFVDIGRKNLVPLITNNGISFKDESGRTWKTKSGKAQRAIFETIRDTRQLPKGIDVLFSSYSQVEKDLPSGYRHPSRQIRASMHARRQPPPDGFRMEALRAIAPNTFFILDESHLASGDSMTAWRMAPLLTASKATYYSSATFAKRPDNIGIYFKTTLSRAAGDMQHLIEAMQLGGVPLQQAVVAMLAEDGLYLRRERDFGKSVYRTHINIDTKVRDRELADTYTSGLRRILKVSNDIKDITDALNDLLGQQGTRLGLPSAPNLSSTNFSSIIHNLVSQYLLSIKTKATVERALYHIEGGPPPEDGTDPERQRRRVVVTVQNTMESAIRALERGNYEKSFKGLLRRYLDRQRTLTSGSGPTAEEFYISDKPDPNFEGQSDQQLISQMMTVVTNAEGQREAVFNRPVIEEYFRRQASALIATVADYIETLELGDMPLSPIDYMRQAIEEAGYKTVEITGRKKGMRKDGTVFDISEAENSKKAQLEYMDQFNNGDAWFLIMNDSGSTGISLQSKKTFKNLQQRAMLIAQPHLAIDKFMQSLWRIDRTGQVHPPFFELIQTAIPAELRPAAVLERKMASLNANTTSNAKNEMKKQDLDIFNQYGDEKVWEYLASDMDFTRMLDMDAKLLDRRGNLRPLESLDFENGQLVAAVTGRLAILPVVQGDLFWDRVNQEYRTFIEYLTSTGQNTLIVSTIDMKAETLEKTEYTPGNPNPTSAFDGPSVLEKVKGQMGKAPRHGNDVLLETGRVAREESEQLQAQWRTAQRVFHDAEEARRITLEAENLTPAEEIEAQAFPSKEDYVRGLTGDNDKLKNWRERMRNARNLISNSLRLLGDTVHIHNARGLDVYGGVVKAKLDLEKPLTPSAQQFTVWVNSTMRQINMAATQLATDAVHFDREHFVEAYEENAERSNERYIITGNLLAASVNMGQVQNARIITYTDNKGDLHQGILMPVAWNPHTATGMEAVTDYQHFRQLLEDGRTVVSRNQSLMVHKRAAGVYEIRMPAGRSTGGKWWGDSTLRGMMNGANFEQKGSNFVGKFGPNRLQAVFERITGEDPALATPLFFNRPVTPGGNPQGPLMASQPNNPRAVKAAAYKDSSGKVHEGGFLEPHWKISERLGQDLLTEKGMGFVTNEGEFLTRRQAWKRGQEEGQLGKGPVLALESRDIEFGPLFGPIMASAPAFARDYWNEDVRPLLGHLGVTTKEILNTIAKVLTPTFGVNKDAMDQVFRMLGDRNQVAYIVDQTGEAFEKMFNSMPRADQITFVDRVKEGNPQPTPELQAAADFIRKVDEQSWEALTAAAIAAGMRNNPVAWLENHYRVMWKKIPDHPEMEGRRGGRSPLRGTRGMAKQHTLATMSEGIERGGEPFSYNPIVNLKMALADIWKYTTALKIWAWGKDNGFVSFVRGTFPELPEGMVWLEDSIADVWFPAESGEGLVHGGKYAVEEGFGRVLNNFLSRDLIRQTKTGRSLMWIKNATTSLELALSLFHGVFETLETVASSIGLGLSKIYNRGLLGKDTSGLMQGMMDLIKSPATPVTTANLGSQFRKMAGKPDEFWATPEGRAFLAIHPDARYLIDLLFTGGFKPTEIEADWKNQSVRAFMDSLKNLKEGTSTNYIGAGLRAFPAATEFMMGPLFDRYIPNLKIGQFVMEMREALRVNDLRYGPQGYYVDRQGRRYDRPTNAQVARQVWRLVEDRFGELNYDTLFWNQTFKAAMQLMFRSVTWKFGSIEAFGRAAGGQGKEFIDAFKERRAPQLHRNMAWLFGIFLLTAALGTVISVVLGKHRPNKLADFVFPRIDPTDPRVRVSIPTYFKDLVHLLHSPTGYVKASLAGWIGRVAELLSNKDYYGVQIRDTDDPATKQALQVGKHAAESLLPFSIRGYRNLSQNQENTLRKSMALFGITPAPRYIGQTPAEHEVENYWRGQRTEEGIKPEQFEIQKGKRELVSKLRHGQSVNIPEALKKGTLKPHDIPALYKRAAMGPLASGIDKMSLADAEKVYAKANATEKRELAGILARKRANALRRSGRTMYTGF